MIATGTISNETFARVYLEYRNMLFCFIVRMVENREQAKDMVMEVFTRALEKRDRLRDEDHLLKFLFVVAKNQCITYLQWRAGRVISMENVPEVVEQSFEHELVRYETVKELYTKMAQLPGQRRQVMTLLFKEGLNPREVSQSLRIPEKMIKVIKSQSIKQLKTLIYGK